MTIVEEISLNQPRDEMEIYCEYLVVVKVGKKFQVITDIDWFGDIVDIIGAGL